MDQMLPSPSFNIPSIGTPHHALEEVNFIKLTQYSFRYLKRGICLKRDRFSNHHLSKRTQLLNTVSALNKDIS